MVRVYEYRCIDTAAAPGYDEGAIIAYEYPYIHRAIDTAAAAPGYVSILLAALMIMHASRV